MMLIGARLNILYRNVWNGVLGILAELLLIAFIILAGLIVCLLWWGLFR